MFVKTGERIVAESGERLSENYLRAVDAIVKENGGWEAVSEWEVGFEGGSFTSVRGLAVLINALAPIHNISVSIIDGEKTLPASLPIEPVYHANPNITSKPQ